MKIFLKCILKNNLGDDLFGIIIANRYKNHDFYAIDFQHSDLQPKPTNIKLIHINNFLYKAIRKLSKKVGKRCLVDDIILNKTDLAICIGGSVFMEKKDPSRQREFDWYRSLDKNYYIIGANIGPVYTEKYIDKINEEIFANAKDVCLRDKTSLKYVKTKNVRWAPDIIFSENYDKYIAKNDESKEAIISVINLAKKASQMRNFNIDKYRQTIISMINEFKKQNYTITLFSFCQEEGDEDEINTILTMLPSTEKVNTYFYKGDYKEALKKIGRASLVVGSRFHAVVLGFAMNKKVIPIIYNDKTRNLLFDLEYRGKFIDIEKDIYPENQELFCNKKLPKSTVAQLRIDAEKHFKKIDKVLGYE